MSMRALALHMPDPHPSAQGRSPSSESFPDRIRYVGADPLLLILPHSTMACHAIVDAMVVNKIHNVIMWAFFQMMRRFVISQFVVYVF